MHSKRSFRFGLTRGNGVVVTVPRIPAIQHRWMRMATALAIVLVFVAVSALSQTPVPPTARQAAAVPEFVQRLQPPAVGQTNHVASIIRKIPKLPQSTLYANGPVNGICDIQGCTVDAYTINFGFEVTNSIGVGGTVSGFEFAFWMLPGDTISSVDWSLGSAPFGSDIAHGTASGSNLSSVLLASNQYGYDIYQVAISGLNTNIAGGTWLTLQNASVASGDPVYWDENNGPSQAQENNVGTIPSESFNVTGGNPICRSDQDATPHPLVARAATLNAPASPSQTFTVIHDFDWSQGGNPAAGLAMDHTENLYGTVGGGGANDDGAVYRMSPHGSGWAMSTLYTFAGGADGASPYGDVTVSPNGTLYSTTVLGGGNGCNAGTGCGTVLTLRPGMNARANAVGQWSENQLYRFTGGSDGNAPSSSIVLDAAGNAYGVTYDGGAYGHGSVFELQRTGGGWQYQLLYSFTGGNDGADPIDNFLIDALGNLYGATYTGGYAGCGTVFELSPSSNGWTEKTIHTFTGQGDAGNPEGLTMDTVGNLYGVTSPVGCLSGFCGESQNADAIFMLSPSQGDWTFTAIGNYSGLYMASISMGADGNLYGLTAFPGYLFKLSSSGGIWTYTLLFDFSGTDAFWPEGRVVLDSEGNIYGITNQGGAYSAGTVWQLKP